MPIHDCMYLFCFAFGSYIQESSRCNLPISRFRVLTMDAVAEIAWVPHVTVGQFTWKPKTIIDIGGEKFVQLKPADYGLVHLIAGMAHADIKDFGTRPTIANCQGLIELKILRNTAQMQEMQAPADAAPGLFDSDELAPSKKKQKLRRDGISDPEAFTVVVDEDSPVVMKRPQRASEDLVIKLDEESLNNAFRLCWIMVLSVIICRVANSMSASLRTLVTRVLSLPTLSQSQSQMQVIFEFVYFNFHRCSGVRICEMKPMLFAIMHACFSCSASVDLSFLHAQHAVPVLDKSASTRTCSWNLKFPSSQLPEHAIPA